MIPIKIANFIIKFLLVVALLLIGLSTTGRACDENMALDMETMICEDVNLTLNPKWEEFYIKDLK